MKTPRPLILASTALALLSGLPALAGMPAPGCTAGVCAALLSETDRQAPLIRVSGEDEDGWFGKRHGSDCDDDDDDDDDCSGTRGNAAPAGTVPPPANGLFGNGAPPVAVTN